MKTKKELMAEMEADKKVLDKYFVKTEIVDYDNICLLFRIFGPSKEILISVTQHYRPEIKPPALGIGVWGRHGGTFVSKGQFDSTGRLLCFDGCAILPWCSIVDPSHHSENWDEEWLPENLRNK